MANTKERLGHITQISNNEEAAVALFNENVNKTNRSIEDSLSRSGKGSNEMLVDLDMGGKRIINVGAPKGALDLVRYKDIEEITPAVDKAKAEADRSAAYANEAVKAASAAAYHKEESEELAGLAQAWALADDFDDRLEGESSSKAYSNLAMAIANAPEDTPVNMSELQSRTILKGDSASIKIANVSTLPAGHEAYVRNIGTERDAVFEIGLPRADNDHYAQGNLGDIRSTTATVLPKGCEWCSGQWLTEAQYPDMYAAVKAKQVAVTTSSNYDSQVSSNGACVFFVIDEANKRFRVPTLKGNIMFGVASGVAPYEYGKYQQAGLPNVTGTFDAPELTWNNGVAQTAASGSLYAYESVHNVTATGSNGKGAAIGFDASRSNPLFGRSNTVQPEALLLHYYVVLSESRKSIYCPKSSVATFADLPMSGNILGDTRVALDTSTIYVWAQTLKGSYTWTSLGSSASSGGVSIAEWGSIEGDITAQADLQEALAGKANIADIPDVPTKTSQLENDSGFITAEDMPEPDLTGCLDNKLSGQSNSVGILSRSALSSSDSGLVSIGSDSQAGGTGATAIGFSSYAAARGTAMGYDSNGTGSSSIAIGYKASATKSSTIAIGSETSSSSGASASSENAIAIGSNNVKASGSQAIALGKSATASSGQSIAIGSSATAKSYSACLAIGANATSSHNSAVAIGQYSNASGNYGVAVGAQAVASGDFSSAFGNSAEATQAYAIQIGKGTNSTANTMSVGLSDSLNVQLLDASGKIPAERLPDDIGGTDLTGCLKNTTNTDLASLVVVPEGATVVQSGAVSQVAFGTNSLTLSGSGATAFGGYTKAQGNKTTALGFGAKATAVSAIQIGNGTNTTANTMNVALSDSLNVTLLDASGKIPDARLPEGFGAPATSTGTALEFGASNTEYEAPEDGYFAFYAQYNSGTDAFVSLRNTSTISNIVGMEHFWYSSKGAARLFCPARKGHKAIVEYNCTLKNVYFYFIPSRG